LARDTGILRRNSNAQSSFAPHPWACRVVSDRDTRVGDERRILEDWSYAGFAPSLVSASTHRVTLRPDSRAPRLEPSVLRRSVARPKGACGQWGAGMSSLLRDPGASPAGRTADHPSGRRDDCVASLPELPAHRPRMAARGPQSPAGRTADHLSGRRDELRSASQIPAQSPAGRTADHLIGAPGFEPGTFGSQSRRATGLRHTPLTWLPREFGNNPRLFESRKER
jgi:hypothetical protein